jgi:UDP-GlcNAc3NAcA epimerase
MKIVTIVGARPQFIKAASVSRAIQKSNQEDSGSQIQEIIVHTGQHYDHNMSQVFFDELEIREPDYYLGVGSGNHGEITGTMLAKIEEVLLEEKPDSVLVYGDTNSTLAGALAAAKLHIPVAHVEAGLRSFNKQMPEEINRVLTDHLSTLFFCPTETAVKNLENEGIIDGVSNVGDVMYDAALYYQKNATKPNQELDFALATLHRAENTDNLERLCRIFSGLGESPVPVILPLHPRTKKVINQANISLNDNVHIVEPLPYLSMLGHLEACKFVITDSGGLQKEAFFFGKRCITVRDETEWVELVDCGANRIVGAKREAIVNAFNWAMSSGGKFPRLYGNGNASLLIIHELARKSSDILKKNFTTNRLNKVLLSKS